MPLTLAGLDLALAPLLDVGGALPTLAGVSPALLARHVYRSWLAQGAEWAPYFELGTLERRWVAEAARVAAGGWLFLPGPARVDGVRVLHPGGAPLDLEPDTLAALIARDQHHLVATDPALTRLRASLLALCRGGAIVLLQGPAGSGRRSLAWWAHAEAGSGHRLRRASADGAAEPGDWLVYEDADRLPPAAFSPLRARLAPAAPPPPALPPSPRPNHPAFERIVGDSPALAAVLAQAERYAPTQLSVLVLGESGTGKELLAEALHRASPRRAGPFVAVDLAAIPGDLVEAELFGYRKGAFTGATRDHDGVFQRADRGTLFLDELGNLSLAVQVKLLRALQQGEVLPVGAREPVHVDVRVVAATNADLEEMARQGEFRADLLYRFAVRVVLPPLRHRGDDVVLLAERFLAAAQVQHALRHPATLTPEARLLVRRAPWPGNVRELQHTMSRAAVDAQADRGRVGVGHLLALGAPDATPAPVLLSADAPPERWAVEPALGARLGALTLHVPPSWERPRTSIRNAVLARLAGHAVEASVVDALVARAWRGGLAEIEQVVGALHAAVPGPIERASVAALLPHLLEEEPHVPIRVLMHPTARWDPARARHEIRGMEQIFRAGALLVGRIRGWHEVAPDDLALQARAAEVQAKLGPVQPAFFALEHQRALSRLHLLVSFARGASGPLPELEVTLLAPRLRARARALEDANFTWLAPGHPHGIGSAGQVEIHRDGAVYLDFFFIAGDAAFEEAGRTMWVAQREAVPRATVGAAEAAPLEPERDKHLGRLTTEERHALHTLVLSVGEGSFSRHIAASLERPELRAQLGRLAERLAEARRPDQVLTRWYETQPGMDRELRERLAAHARAGAILERLPRPLAELVRGS